MFILNTMESSTGMDEDARECLHLLVFGGLEFASTHFSSKMEDPRKSRGLVAHTLFEVFETDANASR